MVVELGNFLPQLGMGALGVYATGPASYPVYMITAGLAIGGCVGLALSKGIAVNERLVGAATVLVAVLAAPALALAVGAVEHNYVPLPTRYGASLLPWALLSAGILVDSQADVDALSDSLAGRARLGNCSDDGRRLSRLVASPDVPADDLPRILVIVPAWNEQECIANTVREIRAKVPYADLLVVDDGSRDDPPMKR